LSAGRRTSGGEGHYRQGDQEKRKKEIRKERKKGEREGKGNLVLDNEGSDASWVLEAPWFNHIKELRKGKKGEGNQKKERKGKEGKERNKPLKD
jgi:hypothetical protein